MKVNRSQAEYLCMNGNDDSGKVQLQSMELVLSIWGRFYRAVESMVERQNEKT